MSNTVNQNKSFPKSKVAIRRAVRRFKIVPPQRRQVYYALCEVYRAFKLAEEWDNLTPVQKIKLEEFGLDKLQELLELYSRHVSHNGIKYRLREAEPEELEGEGEEEA
jgi:hypothetical protein